MITNIQKKARNYMVLDQAWAQLAPYRKTEQPEDDSSPRHVFIGTGSLGNVSPNFDRADELGKAYGVIAEGMNWVLCGASISAPAGVLLPVSSPSSYPVCSWDYIEYLQSAKRDLETRVDGLERELTEMRAYWPTVKRLIDEHTAATHKVTLMIRELNSTHGPRGSLDIARRRDLLSAPLDERFEEIE